MTDEVEAINAAMQSLRSYRRDKQAHQKRRAREAIAASIDPWIATIDDAARDHFVNGICAAASKKNADLIRSHYAAGKA